MVLMTTTYRHDFVPPSTNRYKFVKTASPLSPEECAKLCPCGRKYPLDGVASLPESGKTHVKNEWTGIAPMGLLIDPRIIPTDLSGGGSGPDGSNKDQNKTCMEDQPNRFLKILRTCYPDLYERLNKMPTNELHRRLNVERLKTSYQIDFCNIPEYPEGIYQSLEDKNADGKSDMLILSDGCAQYKNDPNLVKLKESAECQDTYKPIKTNFADAPAPIKSGGDFSHWSAGNEFSKKPRLTEYMDSVSRTGCIIVKNNIHSHNKCHSGKNCLHKLKHPCNSFK